MKQEIKSTLGMFLAIAGGLAAFFALAGAAGYWFWEARECSGLDREIGCLSLRPLLGAAGWFVTGTIALLLGTRATRE